MKCQTEEATFIGETSRIHGAGATGRLLNPRLNV
jgi:hypothetical protein